MALHWRGFELHPEIPVGGMGAERLFGPGGRERAAAYMKSFAASFGIIDMVQPDHVPNTRAALAVAELARDHDLLDPFRVAALDAYWREGRDLEDPEVIGSLGSAVGLNPDEAAAAMTDPRYLGRIGRTREEAGAAGVTGIPTFFIGEQKIVGCQPYSVLAEAVERAKVEDTEA